MKNLTAKHVMNTPVVSARPNATARDIVLQLLSGLYSGMPVTDEQGKLIGIVTEFDILKQVKAGKDLSTLNAEEVMTKEVVTVELDAPLDKVLNVMLEKNIIRIPVTHEGHLIGVIARCDILKTLIGPEFVTYAVKSDS